MQLSIQNQKNTKASIKRLKIEVGTLEKQQSHKKTIPTNTDIRGKEPCQVVVTRRGKELGVSIREKKMRLKKKERKIKRKRTRE